MIDIKPSDIDKTLGEVLKEHQENSKFNIGWKLTPSTKYVLGNSFLFIVSAQLFNFATDGEYSTAKSIVLGVGIALLMTYKKLAEEFKGVIFVEEFCKRRGLKRMEFRDFDEDLSYKPALLEKKIRAFDIPDKASSKKHKM